MRCLVHGDDEIVEDSLGRRSCAICTRARARANLVARRNQKTDGRHPRETLLFVPNDLLRERFEAVVKRGARSAGEVAVAAGYETRRNRAEGMLPDIQRLKKQLGIVPVSGPKDPLTGTREARRVDKLGYDVALRICRALGVEYPAEVGL